MDRLSTKILVDGGDPRETQQAKERLGFVDGQTTNPSLVAKNPHIQQRLAAGHKLTQSEELNAYRDIVREIAPAFPSRYSPMLVLPRSKCSPKVKRFLRGFPMPTSSILAPPRACALRSFPLETGCASI